MSNDKLHDFVSDQAHSHHQPGNVERSTEGSDGTLTVSRSAMAKVLSFDKFTDTKRRGGKRAGGLLPTALGGRVPQHPVFVPAGHSLTSSSSRR